MQTPRCGSLSEVDNHTNAEDHSDAVFVCTENAKTTGVPTLNLHAPVSFRKLVYIIMTSHQDSPSLPFATEADVNVSASNTLTDLGLLQLIQRVCFVSHKLPIMQRCKTIHSHNGNRIPSATRNSLSFRMFLWPGTIGTVLEGNFNFALFSCLDQIKNSKTIPSTDCNWKLFCQIDHLVAWKAELSIATMLVSFWIIDSKLLCVLWLASCCPSQRKYRFSKLMSTKRKCFWLRSFLKCLPGTKKNTVQKFECQILDLKGHQNILFAVNFFPRGEVKILESGFENKLSKV